MTQQKQVALLVTCLVDQVLPDIGVATLKILRRAGYEVDFPPAQTCCGQPFFNSGFMPEAVRLAKRTIEIFEPYEAVVLPSGSCTAMIRKEYPRLLGEWASWEKRAHALREKTFELSEFLSRQASFQIHPTTTEKSSTYHDSCHMCRGLDLKDEPRELLKQAGYSINEMKGSDRCCGFGGLFSARMPEISNAMTRDKLQDAKNSGAKVIVTADPGCLLQMQSLVEDDSPALKHIAEILEEATR